MTRMNLSKELSYPAILNVPGSVVSQLCNAVDNPAVHNWRSLVEHLEDYSQYDVLKLRNIRQCGGSPTKQLLTDLHSRGWSILDLCTLARRARIQSIVDILVQYCQNIDLDPVPLQSTESADSRTAAKSCSHRAGYPATIVPPLHMQEEAKKRYALKTPDTHRVPESRDSKSNGSKEEIPSTDGLPHFSYEVLLVATGGLNETPHSSGGHKLGEGGFGEVFYCQVSIKGEMVEAAVKVFRKREEAGSGFGTVNKEQFSTEVSSLSRISHPHLLSLLGYSSDGPHLCLLYPFLQKGSLDRYVTDGRLLPPPTRVGVAVGVASALDYLHTGVEGGQIVHRDVKSANVLLGSDWTAKLGDFGVARIVPSEASSLMTTTIVGTTIFMAPEYRTGTVTPAADVYALGVVLFELLTGRSALDKVTTETGEETDLVTFILELEEESEDILIGSWDEGVWKGVWSMAEKCLEHFDFKRPTSKMVYEALSKFHPQ